MYGNASMSALSTGGNVSLWGIGAKKTEEITSVSNKTNTTEGSYIAPTGINRSAISTINPNIAIFKNNTPTVNSLLSHPNSESIKSFISSKSDYNLGDWVQWNQEFCTALKMNNLSKEEMMDIVKDIQIKMGFKEEDVDGKLGPQTLKALAGKLDITTSEHLYSKEIIQQYNSSGLNATSTPYYMDLDKFIKKQELINSTQSNVSYEGNYQEMLSSFLRGQEGCNLTPDNPGVASGTTIGYGFDLKYASRADKEKAAEIIGTNVRGLKNISKITIQQAEQILQQITIPKFTNAAIKFVGGKDKFDLLPDKSKIALVSLIFNRGTDTNRNKKSRIDVANLQDALRSITPENKEKVLKEASTHILNMNRTMANAWSGHSGLFTRRQEEASLMFSGTFT